MEETIVDRIEEAIRSRFAEGIELSAETVHFIESTFDAATAKALADLFARQDGDTEVLVDLFFSADETLRFRLEALMAPEGLAPGQRGALADRLRKNPLRTQVRIGNEAPLSLALPGEMVDGFADRLNLDRPLQMVLATAIAAQYPENEAIQVRARLREARCLKSRSATEALAAFFPAASPSDPDFWPLLDYLIGFLQSAPGDLFAAFADRKTACFRHLQEAAGLNRTLARHNIETILVGGTRLPHVDHNALQLEIVRIDDLCRKLFGRAAPAPSGAPAHDLGEVSSREALDRMMRFFTGS